MSRTRHVRRGEARPRHSPVVRMTRARGEWCHPHDHRLAAEGNSWPGTIAAVGGDQRRRDQRDQRERKILGRRRDRRRRGRELMDLRVRELAQRGRQAR